MNVETIAPKQSTTTITQTKQVKVYKWTPDTLKAYTYTYTYTYTYIHIHTYTYTYTYTYIYIYTYIYT